LKLSYDGSDSGSKKCKHDYGGAHGGSWPSLLLAGIWSQAVGFMFLHLASATVKIFIYFTL
jgi:hypothetical protein